MAATRDPGPQVVRPGGDPAIKAGAVPNAQQDAPTTDGDGKAEAARDHRQRAEQRIGAGDVETGLKHLSEARKAAPADADLAVFTAKTMVRAGDGEGACKVLKDALAASRGNPKADKKDQASLKKYAENFCDK